MDVLFLSQRVPYPPDRGDRITTFHFLRHYAEQGARLRIGCFSEGPRDDAAVPELVETLRAAGAADVAVDAPRLNRRMRKLTCVRALLGRGPMTLPFFAHTGLDGTVRSWLGDRRPDVIHVYSSSMAQYVLDADAGIKLMQFAELDSDKWRQFAAAARNPAMRWLYAREARTLLAFEAEVAHRFDVSTVCSPVEAELFRERIPEPSVRLAVLPNGVDVEHFASAGDAARGAHTVVFTGVMDYEPNVDGVLWFVRECWPTIRSEFADAEFLVVGSKPTAQVRALDGRDGIRVTGRVDEIPPWLDRAAVAVAPLRLARGVQNKVLEAMSMALPVVSTPQAAQGIEDDGDGKRPLVVAADAESITREVLELLRDPARARELGERAARFVRTQYRWESMFARIDGVLSEGAADPQRNSTRT